MSIKNAIKLDASGCIVAFNQFEDEIPEGWVDTGDRVISIRTTRCKWVDGDVVDTGQPWTQPRANMAWDAATDAWVDARTLEQFKADKWAEIKAKRQDVEFSGFTWDGSTFDSDPLSQSRIQGAVQLAGLNPTAFTIDWTLADNTVRTLSATQMVEVGETLGIHVATQHTIARGLRQQIEVATTAAEVEAIAWPQ